MTSLEPPKTLLERFPHLQHEISLLSERDPGFRQLSDDFELLVQSLGDSAFQAPEDKEDKEDKEEMINLKASLEFEALELLSQIRRY
jgi:hypothetical protein